MISVLTLTYQRHHILEEAIQSFLLQDWEGDSEMVVLNDSPLVKYEFDHPKVRIINCDTRFSSIGKKLEYGFAQCKGNYIYRLDDDDLMTSWALSLQAQYRADNPDFDIYRCQKHYFFCHNEYEGLADNINNGNCYSKYYTQKLTYPNESVGEDNNITFHQNAKIHIGNSGRYSMIYRWGMGTFHVSGMGAENTTEYILDKVDQSVGKMEEGTIVLNPHFKQDYYSKLPK
jgi:hypothetical protein